MPINHQIDTLYHQLVTQPYYLCSMNSKLLLFSWLKTLSVSFILSILVGLGFAMTEMHGRNLSQVAGLVAWGAAYLNAVLFIMSMVSLFLTVPQYYQNQLMRLLLHFGGSLMFVIALLFVNINGLDRAFYLMVGVVYMAVSIFFYRRLVKKAGH